MIEPRPLLRDVVHDRRLDTDDYHLVQKLVGATKLVASPELACDGLWPGGKELGRLEKQERDARVARSQSASRACVKRIHSLLK